MAAPWLLAGLRVAALKALALASPLSAAAAAAGCVAVAVAGGRRLGAGRPRLGGAVGTCQSGLELLKLLGAEGRGLT